MSVAKRIDEKRARIGSHRPRCGRPFALALDDLGVDTVTTVSRQ
jgi:hypothetical protein